MGTTPDHIVVSDGFDCDGNRIIHKKTWRPPANMSERQAEKMANKEAVLFEQSIMQGYAADNKQTFAECAEYVLQLKERISSKMRNTCYLLEWVWAFAQSKLRLAASRARCWPLPKEEIVAL